jgi:hypothetical protein
MDKPNGKSFASLVYDKLRKYKLPDLMDLMKNPIEKHKWKKLVKQHICCFFGTVFQTWCEFPKSGCCKFRNFKVDFVCFSSILLLTLRVKVDSVDKSSLSAILSN